MAHKKIVCSSTIGNIPIPETTQMSAEMNKLWCMCIHKMQNSIAMKNEQTTAIHIITSKSRKPKGMLLSG